MSRGVNERGHDVLQRYQYETLPIPFPISPLPKPSHATWQYPQANTLPFPPSILSLAASTALPPFTQNFLGPCHKYLNSNVNGKSALCTWVTPAIPASTSKYDDQHDITLVSVKTSPSFTGSSVGRDEDIDKRDVDNVKGKRAPQIPNESMLSSAKTASNGSPSLSQPSPSLESLTGSSTSFISSSILTLTTIPVPESSVTSTPPSFTSTSTIVTPTATTTPFPLTSSAPTSPTTSANGVTSPTPISTPSPTTGTTTTIISTSPDSSSLSTSTITSLSMASKSSSLPASFPTVTYPTTPPFATSISGLPTSLSFTTPPSASNPFSSTTKVPNITSFTSSFITTPSSSIPPSSPEPESTSFTSSNLPPWMTQSSSPSKVWFTATSTKVYTSTFLDGSMTVVTTVVRSGMLSTNTALSGDRFGGNTGAIIAVAVCATVGVIIFVFIVFFLCKRYRERKERQKRRRSRRPGLRAVPISARPDTGDSGGSGRVGSSRANILAAYGREWARSLSGGAGPSEDGEDEEDVWRSPLVGEDDEVAMGMGGVDSTTPESGDGKPAAGRKSSIGHQSGHSHSLGHSQHSSGHHGQGQGVPLPPSMAEFGMGPVSYAAYAHPSALVGFPAYHSGVTAGGGGGEGSGMPGGEGQSSGLDSYGSRASYGAFVPYGPNSQSVPYPSPVAVSGAGTGCHVLPTTNVVETKDKPGQRPGSSRRQSEGEASSASMTTATPVGASGLKTSGSRRTSGSKGSIRSIGSKSLRGFMDRILTSVPNIQVPDGVLPTRRSSKDMASPPSASGSGGERPGYDYGSVGRPRVVSGVPAPPPVAFVHPGFHITPPGVLGVDVPSDLPRNPQVDISNHYHGPMRYGYPVPAVNGEGGIGVDEDDDSLRIPHGLLDPNISLIRSRGGNGGSVGGSPSVEGGSLRDSVDYSRKIAGTVKNHIARSTTTFDTVDQDGSIHLSASGGGPPTPG